jgi:alcohol dehydrogenase class IV
VAAARSELARRTGRPTGLSAIGFGDTEIAILAEGALAQRRLIDNAPAPLNGADIEEVVRDSLILWQPERRRA